MLSSSLPAPAPILMAWAVVWVEGEGWPPGRSRLADCFQPAATLEYIATQGRGLSGPSALPQSCPQQTTEARTHSCQCLLRKRTQQRQLWICL